MLLLYVVSSLARLWCAQGQRNGLRHSSLSAVCPPPAARNEMTKKKPLSFLFRWHYLLFWLFFFVVVGFVLWVKKGCGSVRVFLHLLMILLCHVLSFFFQSGLTSGSPLPLLSQVSVLFRKREGVHDSTHMCQRSVIHVVALPRVPMLPFSLSFFSGLSLLSLLFLPLLPLVFIAPPQPAFPVPSSSSAPCTKGERVWKGVHLRVSASRVVVVLFAVV